MRWQPAQVAWVELDELGPVGNVERLRAPGRSGATVSAWNRIEAAACGD
jgi:hypothetical protein